MQQMEGGPDIDNTALITGGSKGIGKAIAIGLQNNHNLHLVGGTDEETALEVGRVLEASEVTPGDIFDRRTNAHSSALGLDRSINILNAAMDMDNRRGQPARYTPKKQVAMMEKQNFFFEAMIERLLKNNPDDPKLVVVINSIMSAFTSVLSEEHMQGSPYSLMKYKQLSLLLEAIPGLTEAGVSVSAILPAYVKTGLVEHMSVDKKGQPQDPLKQIKSTGKTCARALKKDALVGDIDTVRQTFLDTIVPTKLIQENQIQPTDIGRLVSYLVAFWVDEGNIPEELQLLPIMGPEDVDATIQKVK